MPAVSTRVMRDPSGATTSVSTASLVVPLTGLTMARCCPVCAALNMWAPEQLPAFRFEVCRGAAASHQGIDKAALANIGAANDGHAQAVKLLICSCRLPGRRQNGHQLIQHVPCA